MRESIENSELNDLCSSSLLSLFRTLSRGILVYHEQCVWEYSDLDGGSFPRVCSREFVRGCKLMSVYMYTALSVCSRENLR